MILGWLVALPLRKTGTQAQRKVVRAGRRVAEPREVGGWAEAGSMIWKSFKPDSAATTKRNCH